ncbi:MAG: dTDP-glucose 4,6-dehydratase [Lentisphaeria bacterium]
MSQPQSILVTGGAGFIGSNFVNMLLDKEPDITIVNLDSLTYAGNLENLAANLDNPRHIFLNGDIREPETVNRAITEYKVDGIINFAAESHVDRSITGPQIFIETNVSGTLVLLQAALENNIKRFLQVSTDEVYGSLGDTGKFREDTPVSPNSPYSASKTAADHLVHAYNHTFGLPTVITRCSNNYGPYQFPEKMLPLMFNNARQDKPLPVYGDGLNVRDWIYVLDHADAIWKVFQEGQVGEVYNVGGDNEMTNLAVVQLILQYLEKPESLITFVKDRPGHDHRYAIDMTRINTELDWHPSVTFEEGLKRTLDWYSDNGAWLDHVTSGTYQQYYEKMYGA